MENASLASGGCLSVEKTFRPATPNRPQRATAYAMTRTHTEDLPWTAQNSPKGKYGIQRRSVSQAAGGQKDIGTWGGGHPFDLEIHRIPPGKINFPLHEHSAQWEAYYILSGSGEVITSTACSGRDDRRSSSPARR